MPSDPDHELTQLQVLDCLEVGPPRIEPRRIQVKYTIRRGTKTDSFEFAYRFEEPVFDPQQEDSHNLAAVLGAQVALNYGLFCKQIRFCGPHDASDRKFLSDMAANTAREIYVKKLLEPNPFITGSAANLPVVKLDSYLLAEIVFEGEPQPQRPPTSWSSEHDRFAVLSSGGKESLLSYGLLKDVGGEVHPVFINESGRHWFTALNAFRYLRQHDDRTARVWTNADRLFTWVLRHLPLVRPDFANRRADIYPIRLWTVALLVFGALPLLRKRRIGCLVVGDEYDTTLRKTHQGIPHYNGLYDQSRYFDNALTRYFHAKGWNVRQFSILRLLSELLIEKILCERYPELQQQQVSCHAAHRERDRFKPCGLCEKCRRITSMLTALGFDPQNCGYTPAQVAACLKSVVQHGTHQDEPDRRHLAWMLYSQGLISEPRNGSVPAEPRPEIMKLRFNAERAPVNLLPRKIRSALYPILLKHAAGAVRKQGSLWVDCNPAGGEFMIPPYPFEGRAMSKPTTNRSKPPANSYLLHHMTWPEAKVRFKEVDVALLPVGAIEQHGPHLPLDTDAFDAEFLAREVAEGCRDPKPIVLPGISYGVSYHHEDFSGTISVSNETLAQMVYEIGMGCARNGINKLVIINGHGGNGPTLHFAAQRINRDAHILTCVDSGETSDTDVSALIDTPNDVHAGEIETSTSLAVRPELVRQDKAVKSVPRFSSRYMDFSSKRSVGWYARTAKISNSGVMGDPTKATAEKGKKMWEIMIRNLVEFVEQLKAMTLDEIYQRDKY